ncbi:tryptophan dimethylallyltransferase-domain-containing protein [Hypoxylon crocopeplum]|nr:tryptophan dimethylallyltransferase-domain-containing protein [Hypoxylon crocopeplum]
MAMSKILRMRKDLGVTSYSPVIPFSLIPLVFKLGLEALLSNSKLPPVAPITAWEQVSSEIRYLIDHHERYWWRTCGYALAILLRNAGYTRIAQVRILNFFARRIMNNLGVANEPGSQRWKSFMTDDNNPIELSWDWHTGVERPTVRFSIEPIGLDAGTPDDLRNEQAALEFKQSVLRALPGTDMSWFDHFEAFFSEGVDCSPAEGHSSKVFWAFDLGEKELTSKAYFFPGYRARATNQGNLQVISEAITSAPSCTPEKLGPFNQFAEFVNEHERMGRPALELDMFAIDMIDCSKSRLKIYFRNRQTDFRSVRETMSLLGRVTGQDMDVGLRQLRELWESLFDHEGKSEDTPLGQASHRTAGILYNVEFRLGGQAPKAKIYIPVRHYARSDEHVMKSVSRFVDRQAAKQFARNKLGQRAETAVGNNNGDTRREQTPAEQIAPVSAAYAKAFSTIFTEDAISGSRGLHTYIACSIQSGGALRVVSYINPQQDKFKQVPPQ